MTQTPTAEQVNELIEQARSHELGTDFLLHGSLDAVAATFGVHAFVVDVARDQFTQPTVTTEQRVTITA